ncbi:protein kinase domain-containing protein [Diaminobutyricibacter sp. McL0618]|uniref:protein kinase domain-containing protein n=1 Tax=Leifsonia sp. McL0618 TaxID=3415677 RepID=UPI003CF1D6FD
MTPTEEPNWDALNAALNLSGHRLNDEWTVGQRLETDGSFSVAYAVTNAAGRRGFMKVLDLVSVFGELEEQRAAIDDYLAERDLLLLCGQERMTRVVTALDHGRVTLEGFFPPLATVYFIVFELADGDMNGTLSDAKSVDVDIRLHLLHDLAVGLRQLHRRKVAHQDLKPSNMLVFGGDDARNHGKVADLGRAFQATIQTGHDAMLIPGDRSYAPPEQLYGFQHSDSMVRRFGADLYQLGSLISYTFTGVTMNGYLAERLSPEHHWDVYGDGYTEALPYLENAYSEVLAELSDRLPVEVAGDLTAVVEYLCAPDCTRRGHPRARLGHGSIYSLERVISALDLAAVRSRIAGRSAA